MKKNNHILKIDKNKIKKIKIISKKIKFCQYCQIQTKKLIKCSGIDCNIKICKQDVTYINDVPFCPACILEIVRNKTRLIIFKEKIEK